MFMLMPSESKLSLMGINKRFGSLLALADVSIEFKTGEIHAVIGENGAGKSTLMNVIGGFLAPDAGKGEILSDGSSIHLPLGNPMETRACGIEMVHQHFMLVPEFSVAENLALSSLGSLSENLNLSDLTERHQNLARRLGWEVDLSQRTGALPVGVQQRVEILKALASNCKFLVLDEPTAVLSESEVEDLFRVLRELRASGTAVILIAHKLAEVLAIADRVSVLRSGRLVGTALRSETDERTLQEWMTGEVPTLTVRKTADEFGDPSLHVEGLMVKGDRGEEAVRGVDLTVRKGQIVGLGGVDGNGQVELAEAIVGIRPAQATVFKVPLKVGYIPQDRQADALALNMPIKENFLLSRTSDFGGIASPKRVTELATALVDQYKIKVQNINDVAGSLSGGNQQKIVVSRVLDGAPDLLVAVNPTRGLDFQATEFVHEVIRKAAANQMAVLLISTDRDEVAELADVTFQLSGGRLSG